MKLAYVTVSMPTGSAESFLIEEAAELRKRLEEFRIVPRSPCKISPNSDAQALHSVTVSVSPWSLACVAAAVRELIRSPRRCLNAISMVVRAGSAGAGAKNLLSVPKALWLARYVREHEIDHIHSHWAATTATIALVASRITGVPWSLTLHRGDITQNNLLSAKLSHARFARFISSSGIKLARGLVPDLQISRAVVIPMGVRFPKAFTPQEGDSRSKNDNVILCPASLLPVKGHRYLLEACQLLKVAGHRCELWLAGAGPLRASLGALAAELGIEDRVTFMGQVEHTKLLGLYREGFVNAVALPSVDLGNGVHEGIPVSLMEAMAHGIPVISTTTGGIPELVTNGAGILVAPADPGALAEAIELLLTDPELRGRLGQAGRRIVIEGFSVEASVDRLLEEIARCTPHVSHSPQCGAPPRYESETK